MAFLNFGQVIGRLRTRVNDQIDYEEAKAILDTQFRRLLTNHRWSFANEENSIVTVEAKTAGTVAVTNNSAAALGTGTSFAGGDIGKKIRLPDGRSYVVDNVVSQTLTLDTPYLGESNTEAVYELYQNVYTLATDVESILTIAGDQYGSLEEKTSEWLDSADPRRLFRGTPTAYAYLPPVAGVARIEIWPVPIIAYRFNYIGMKNGALTSWSDLITDIFNLLFDLASEDACMTAAAKTKEQLWLTLADRYKGNAQENLFRFIRKDRRRTGTEERNEDLFARYAGDPGVDLGLWWNR